MGSNCSLFCFKEIGNVAVGDSGMSDCGLPRSLGMTVIALMRRNDLAKPQIITMARSERAG